MLDEQDKSTLIGALQYIIRRLQMDIDDGSRPDQWSMEDLVRVANDALKAQQPDPVAAMDEVAMEYAHRLALELECALLSAAPSNYDKAVAVLSEYRSAMNEIHERVSPTWMGEPLLSMGKTQPAPVDADEIERLTREIADLKADRDSWIEQASQRAQETVEAMQQVEAYRLRCEAPHSAPREPLTDEQIANAARWRYWRNYWPALCRMEVARFAGLDLRTTYVQDPAGMDRVTDEAMTRRAHNSGADASQPGQSPE